MAPVCQHYELKQPVVAGWKTEFWERASPVVAGDPQRLAEQERIAELEPLVGRRRRRRWIWRNRFDGGDVVPPPVSIPIRAM